ncbi:MAG TPA: three-Cys-motif partner protein TcmP [Candidatus Limadaptatus stercorigallinarum]|uniref:Three-Cys-motif partner protein TcmP n=1 Tax=Candidatus Limadaptatus stercorigallinarum TaxID=2840845 RepID=A0A9D1L2Q8_9FIRM|nr:three-Cys-motif partner protein TcmP [Candidatus Limadaptatus stercorigallinarum]
MANTKEFFKTKKAWSIYKDELLCSYILPYFNKVMSTGIPIVYIDGFAGKGKFDDGTLGSPLLVKEKLYQAKSTSRFATPINAYFVEYEYADELKSNLSDASLHVIQGDYRIKVKEILDSNRNKNVFLYVDPYGIKYLDFGIFATLDTTKYNSVELLLNLNSFGFLREACRLLRVNVNADDIMPDFAVSTNDIKNDIPNMNLIAHGTYWQEIVEDYQQGKLDIFQAEDAFLAKYMKELSNTFSYVCRIPIRFSKSKLAKYQMIFATNHKHGVFLMADSMIACKNKMEVNINKGQLSIFDYDSTLDNCEDIMFAEIPSEFIDVKDLYLNIYRQIGILYLTKDMNNALKQLESKGKIEIVRTPLYTAQGRPSKSMNFLKNTIKVRRK